MKGRNRTRWAVAAILAICLHIGLWIGFATAGDVDTLTIGVYLEAETLDPHVASSNDVWILLNIYEPLLAIERDLNPVPRLATSWSVSPDAKVYTFNLRKGVKFQDGTPFDAEAVKFNLERIRHIQKGPAWLLAALKSVEVLDPHTVRITLDRPFSPFLLGLTRVMMVSPTAVRKHEEQKGDYAVKWHIEYGIGTGPYKIEKWEHGRSLSLVKFDGYWRGWAGKHVSRVVYYTVLETTTQRMMGLRGDLDIVERFSDDDFEAFKKDPSMVAYEGPSMIQMYLRMNMAAGPTTDVRVRKAISYAFNWKAYDALMLRKVIPSDGPVPSELLGGWRPVNLIREYNPEKARQLLQEAGYGPGHPLKLKVGYDIGEDQKRKIAELFKAEIEKLGGHVDIEVKTWASWLQFLFSWEENRDPATAVHLFIQYAPPRIPNPYAYAYYLWHSEAQKRQRNLLLYSNRKVDEYINSAVGTGEAEKQMEFYRKAAQGIVDDAADLYTEKMPYRAVLRKVVAGWFPFPLEHKSGHIVYYLYKTAP